MRSLLGSVFLLILIAVICLWCAAFTEHTLDVLANTARNTPSDLTQLWKETKFALSVVVNRALLAECECALARMQTSKKEEALFLQAQSDFLTTLSVIRESYGLHFGAVV